ncbi:MAG: preprotein translocase subunit TatC [Phycisphaerae bacterium]|nr:preprotein translocase subunit TatC [Phycisphaerae bacterium]
MPTPDPAAGKNLDDSRMTIGEHLMELRGCVIRCLLALIVACILLAWPSKYILSMIVRPVVLVLQRHGQPDNLLQTSPTELMTIYLKTVVIAGVIVASPIILYEFWKFVAAGLYIHERRWVQKILPLSVGLFLAGVAFMYSIVLLVSLNFLVGFGEWIPLPQPQASALEEVFLRDTGDESTSSQPSLESTPPIPILSHDPQEPPVGGLWYNAPQRKLKLRTGDQTFAVQMLVNKDRPLVTTYFKIGDYLTFVLTMSVAFGVAFQVPLMVVALTRLGIVTVDGFRKARKFVILAILIIAGLLAPPEISSHMLLSIPMILLFELGLLFAARQKKRPRHRTGPQQPE